MNLMYNSVLIGFSMVASIYGKTINEHRTFDEYEYDVSHSDILEQR